jgi:hypothetical protein
VVVGVNRSRPRASSAPRACAAVGGLGLAEHEREGVAGALRPTRVHRGGPGDSGVDLAAGSSSAAGRPGDGVAGRTGRRNQ